MMESLFELLVSWVQRVDSIFYSSIVVAAVSFLIVEIVQIAGFIKRARAEKISIPFSSRVKTLLFAKNPKAPLGWALVPAFFLLLLAGVEWEQGGTMVGVSKPIPSVSVAPSTPITTTLPDDTAAEPETTVPELNEI